MKNVPLVDEELPSLPDEEETEGEDDDLDLEGDEGKEW